jgi:endonuclease/exonuclease/phosphatase family metal-dependent hydrolase
MYLTGSIPQIGSWNERQAIQMDEEMKNGQVFYTKYLDINKDDLPFEYKYFFIKDGNVTWLGKSNINYKAHPQYFHLYQTLHKNKISVFDLNIRYLNDVDGLNVWDYRKEKLVQVILKYSPDILFFQEITRPQYEYMEQNLNSIYENVGVYRDNTDHSEKCSISYNKVKYTLTDWGQFWLSSTPYTPGSNDFGNFFPRICTWALLKQVNGEQFLFFNIHLDHANFSAHLPCMNVVLNESEKVIRKFPDTRMIFLGGCFYCEEDDPLINKLKSSGYNEVMFENTFHDFTGEADRHWDYMFWKERNMERGDTKIELKRAIVPKGDSTIDLNRQQFISDHYPVIAEFEIERKIKSEDLILEDRNKKEFSEMDEEENDKKSEVFEEYENNDNEEKENNEEENNYKEKEEKDNEDKDSDDKDNEEKDNDDKDNDDKDDDDKDNDDKDDDDKDHDNVEKDNDENVDKEKNEKINDKDNENDEENEEVEVIEVEEETEGNNDNEKDDKDDKDNKNNKNNKNNNDEKEDDGEEVEEIEEEIEVVEQDEDGEQEEQEDGE